MYEQQMEFRKMVENRNSRVVEECATKFVCPVVVMDGTLSVNHNLEKIIENVIRTTKSR